MKIKERTARMTEFWERIQVDIYEPHTTVASGVYRETKKMINWTPPTYCPIECY